MAAMISTANRLHPFFDLCNKPRAKADPIPSLGLFVYFLRCAAFPRLPFTFVEDVPHFQRSALSKIHSCVARRM
jgi:hypothetical protein